MNRFSISRFAVPLGALGLVALLSLNLAPIFPQSQKPAVPLPKTSAANIENGKKAFLAHGCFSCHGYSGEGGRGARLVQSALPFDAFVQLVRQPRRAMPPFANQVTDQELADIYAYIKSIPASPDLKNIPLLTNP